MSLSGKQPATVDANLCEMLVFTGHGVLTPLPGQKKLCDPSCDCMQSTHSIELSPGIHVPGRQKQPSMFSAPFSDVMYIGQSWHFNSTLSLEA